MDSPMQFTARWPTVSIWRKTGTLPGTAPLSVWLPVLIGVVIFGLTLTLVVVPLGTNAGDWLQQNLPQWLSWLNVALLILFTPRWG